MLFRYLKYILLLTVILNAYQAMAQRHLISEVKVNPSSVYVGQPVQVSIGVYTTTWFTRGLNPGNIKVNGAFSVYFRSVSQSKKVDGKNYAGVEMIFNIFPYDDEEIVFPALEIEVETPDEGGYKAVKRTVKTTERKIKVKPIPKGYDKDEWLVAFGMTVNDKWAGDLKNVKVGDVLERTISRTVSGTVAELIPPIVWDTLAGASLYPSRSEVSSNKTKTAISASRTDGIRYLFEKEGSVTIPGMVLTWWNPDKNKRYKRTLNSFTINVLPNPNLGMLESVRDSLAVATIPQETGSSDKNILEKLLEKFSWQQLVLFTILLLIFVWLVFKIVKWVFFTKDLIRYIRIRRQQYRDSEKYFFHQFILSTRKKDSTIVLRTLYRWIDQIHLNEPTAIYFASIYGDEELLNEVTQLTAPADIRAHGKPDIHIKNWKKARKKYLDEKSGIPAKVNKNWINP